MWLWLWLWFEWLGVDVGWLSLVAVDVAFLDVFDGDPTRPATTGGLVLGGPVPRTSKPLATWPLVVFPLPDRLLALVERSPFVAPLAADA